MGTYTNCEILIKPWDGEKVNIDKCIVNEIKYLWSLGIETIESCCGHNVATSYVAVKPQFVNKMKLLKYIEEKDTIFYCKTT